MLVKVKGKEKPICPMQSQLKETLTRFFFFFFCPSNYGLITCLSSEGLISLILSIITNISQGIRLEGRKMHLWRARPSFWVFVGSFRTPQGSQKSIKEPRWKVTAVFTGGVTCPRTTFTKVHPVKKVSQFPPYHSTPTNQLIMILYEIFVTCQI